MPYRDGEHFEHCVYLFLTSNTLGVLRNYLFFKLRLALVKYTNMQVISLSERVCTDYPDLP